MPTEVNIAFYNSTNATSLANAYAAYKYHLDNGHTLTLKDLNALTEANVNTYISGLVDGTYDKAYFFTSTAGATGSFTTANKYNMRAKMKTASQGTDGATIENLTTHTTTSIGDSGESWDTNEHAGLHVFLNGGTGANQIAYILSNNATVLTLGETLTTDPDTSTDIAIVTGLEYYHSEASTATTYEGVTKGWEFFYSRPLPYVMHVLSNKFAVASGTSSAIASTSLTHSGAGWTADAYIGMYVQIGTATTNGHQYARITDNTTEVLTVSGWINATSKGTPTGTPAYVIVNTLGEVFANEYVNYYILTYLYDLTDSAVLATWKLLVDKTDGDSTRPAGMPLIQDQDFVFGSVLPTGKTIFEYVYRLT